MNTSIILLIVGIVLVVGILVFMLTRHKKSRQDTVVGTKDKNVTVPVLKSENGKYLLKPQQDANLVVYDVSGKYYWNSYSTNYSNFPQCNPVNSCVYTTLLQTDGNLATYSDKNNTSGTNVTWGAANYPGTNFSKKSDSSAPYTLRLFNNGQIGTYDSNGNLIWSSGNVPNKLP
jgi:hypothetical protein